MNKKGTDPFEDPVYRFKGRILGIVDYILENEKVKKYIDEKSNEFAKKLDDYMDNNSENNITRIFGHTENQNGEATCEYESIVHKWMSEVCENTAIVIAWEIMQFGMSNNIYKARTEEDDPTNLDFDLIIKKLNHIFEFPELLIKIFVDEKDVLIGICRELIGDIQQQNSKDKSNSEKYIKMFNDGKNPRTQFIIKLINAKINIFDAGKKINVNSFSKQMGMNRETFQRRLAEYKIVIDKSNQTLVDKETGQNI